MRDPRLEAGLLDPLVRETASDLAQMLTDDFAEFGASDASFDKHTARGGHHGVSPELAANGDGVQRSPRGAAWERGSGGLAGRLPPSAPNESAVIATATWLVLTKRL